MSFYDDMDSFLKDFITLLPIVSNLEKLLRIDIKAQKVCKKKQSTTIKEDDIQLRRQVMMKALHRLDDLNGNQESSVGEESTDVFGYLIGQSIAEIPEGQKKESLKFKFSKLFYKQSLRLHGSVTEAI